MTEKEAILTAIADPGQLELLKKQLGEEGYEVGTAASVAELMAAIEKDGNISLAVVDVTDFDESVWKQLEELSKSGIPFYVISSEGSRTARKEINKHGARDLFRQRTSH